MSYFYSEVFHLGGGKSFPLHRCTGTGVQVYHTGETRRHLREMEKYMDEREYDGIKRLSLGEF